jgi:hypothetical protein
MCAYRIVIASEAWPKIFCSAGKDPPRIMNQLAKWWRQSWNRNGASSLAASTVASKPARVGATNCS